MLADRFTIPSAPVRRFEGADQRMYHGLIEEDSGAILYDRVQRAPRAKRNHRRAEGHSFHGSDAEVFHSRQNQDACAREMVEDHLSRYGTDERNVGAGSGPQSV